VIPLDRNAPKDWPAEPVNRIVIVSGGNPSSPYLRAMWLDNMVPAVRFTFRIGRSSVTFSPRSMAGLQSSTSLLSKMSASPWSWV